MEICVIHGSARKGNTEKTIEIIKEQLSILGNVSFSDIYLPEDLPHFCNGCTACLLSGEYGGQNCPHKQYTHIILGKLLKCDGIVFASPCYALAETAQVKALLDHLACTYVSHRPNEEMFSKIALVVSTTGWAGSGRVISTISRNLLFWGVKRILKCKITMGKENWNDLSDKKCIKIETMLKKQSKQFYHLTKNRNKISAGFLSVALRFAIKRSFSSRPDTHPDKIYWKSKGWI